MPDSSPVNNQDTSWPTGAAEAAQLIRSTAWLSTSLGASETWSTALRTAVDLLLACQFPMVLLWGADLIQVYNDGYRVIMGNKHPAGMGQATAACWPEVWKFNQPIYTRVWEGESLTFEDQLFPITRHGALEDAYFTLCYSPVRDETKSIGGLLITVLETTAKVHAAKDRDRSEAALRLSEERLRMALSGANGVGIWDWDIVQDRFYADAKFAAVYGVDPELAARGTPLSSFTKNIHPEDLARVSQSIACTIRDGGAYSEEYRLIQPDGSVCWVIAKGQLISSASGVPLRFPGVATEITVQKVAEQACGSLKSWPLWVALRPASRTKSTILSNPS